MPSLVTRLFAGSLIAILVALGGWASGASQTASRLPTIDSATGASIEILASASASWEPLSTIGLRLDRVTSTIASQTLVSNGPELWFAEEGGLTIELPGEHVTLRAGESRVVEAADGISVAFTGDGCSSALRLVVAPAFGMVVESTTDGPSLPPSGSADCPESAVLIDGAELPPPSMPAELVIARLSLQPGSWIDAQVWNGSAGFAVEEGKVSTFGPPGITMGLDLGSWIALAPDTPLGLTETIGSPASVLIAAVLPTGPGATGAMPAGTAAADPDYTSGLFGYSLSWDDSWLVIEESANESGERLVLGNGISTLYVESFADYGENASACVEGVLNRIAGDPAYSNITSLDGAPGLPVVSGDDSIASASMSLSYDSGSISGDYVQVIECREIVAGESVLLITHFAPVDDYPTEVDRVEQVLATLTLASN